MQQQAAAAFKLNTNKDEETAINKMVMLENSFKNPSTSTATSFCFLTRDTPVKAIGGLLKVVK